MPILLPKRWRYAHNVAIDFHDIMVHILKDGHQHGLFETEVKFRNGDSKSFARRGDTPVLEWLEQHQYRKEVQLITIKHVFSALVEDFCHFVLEGLRASEKGKITVAWALFRKAFKDNLFYIEWILSDPKTFLEKFRNGLPKDLDVSNRKVQTEANIIAIIAGAVARTKHPGWVSPEFLFNLRYSKQHPEGLEASWNKASHLITNVSTYATEPGNFNFIFTGPRELKTQWEHLYYYVPFVLYHSALVVEAFTGLLTAQKETVNHISDYHRDAGFYLWSRNVGFPRSDGVCVHPKELIYDLGPLGCPECGNLFYPTLAQLPRLYRHSAIDCRRCGATIDLLRLHFEAVGEKYPPNVKRLK